jgi:rubrerythrin
MPAQIATTEDLAAMEARLIREVSRMLEDLKPKPPETVDTKTAMKILGISSPTTFAKRRKLAGVAPVGHGGGRPVFKWADIEKIKK